MSLHTYTKCWLHLIWNTLEKERTLTDKEVRKRISKHLYENSSAKKIYMKVNYVNPEHVHALIDLPTNYSIEEVLNLFKGESSHWINENKFLKGKFSWGRGYATFSISESNLDKVEKYIINQEEHHKKKSFAEEYNAFIKAYGLIYDKG
jgi:REP element-mobilizing transposase RayT